MPDLQAIGFADDLHRCASVVGWIEMRVALVRGQHLNKWEMQNYEAVDPSIDFTAFSSMYGMHRLEGLRMPIRYLPSLDPLAARSLAGTILVRPVLSGLGVDNRLLGLERMLRRFDVVHAAETYYAFTWQAARAKPHGRYKLITTCWETIPFGHEHLPFIAERKRLVRARVDLYVAMSERAASALRVEGVPSERIRTVLPGIDLEVFRPLPRSSAETLGVWKRSEGVRVLFVGRVDFSKGIRQLLLAAAEVARRAGQTLPVEFAIVGNGPAPIVNPLLDGLGLRGIVSVVPGLPYARMPELYASADIFVLPSIPTPHWEEQFGMVLAESMACGKAIIATTSGAIPEVVGDAGLLIPPYDSSALSESILLLAEDAEHRARLGEHALLRARRLFDVQRFGSDMRRLYEEVMCS